MKNKRLIVPVGMGVEGIVDVELRSTITGKIKRRIRKHNLLLNGFHTRVLRVGYDFEYLGPCYLGDNNTPPQRTDTGLIGNELGRNDSYTISYSGNGEYPAWAKRIYTYYAGTATGNIGEMFIYDTTRITFDPVIQKTSTDELKITYARYMYRGAESWSGTIPGGQRDGVTDVNWVATINNYQLRDIFNVGFQDWVRANGDIGDMRLRIGDSNMASDLINDYGHTIKGNLIYDGGVSFVSRDTYDVSRDYRDITVGLETDKANGQIAEVLPYVTYGYNDRAYYCRVTFDPPLDKTSDYRLYLTFRFGLASW